MLNIILNFTLISDCNIKIKRGVPHCYYLQRSTMTLCFVQFSDNGLHKHWGTRARTHKQSHTGRQRSGAALASGTGKYGCLGSGVPHVAPSPTNQPPTRGVSSRASWVQSLPASCTSPGRLQQHETEVTVTPSCSLLKMESGTESCHAAL